ncbi:uncharacterized protein I303_102465 [Kwoniella dejecticola CBS 10117]|uniref:Uncharacterized protein n=1 Tax=Kwoniella dejecticola CBS 10117 TaxID=1296121 RepID=A0A1A6A8T8_9TREE|nr:uncharacterized protein I303_02480 [Kwoniella dejecticola CBS 10117]OBR86473.1 hypothetical protein I303_02480 [Kwoniella dejecticola CBS 10117]
MPKKEKDPHLDRPFSPSPPRENRHSASRPPSLLFGAPPVGTVAPSSSFSIAGLPLTPPASTGTVSQPFPYTKNLHLQPVEVSHSARVRHASEPATYKTVEEVTQDVRGRSNSVRSGRQRSDSESSTTSSASPPLGATSILSEIATPPRENGTSEYSPQPHEAHSRTSSDPTTLITSITQTPGSPKSYHSGLTSSSSVNDQLSSSHSLPRLHQPTVIRRTSGRGLAFLPPPAHTVSHSTIVSHRPLTLSSTDSSPQAYRNTASISRLHDIQQHASLLELGQPLNGADKEKDVKHPHLIAMKGYDEEPMIQPTSPQDIPLPVSAEDPQDSIQEELEEIPQGESQDARGLVEIPDQEQDQELHNIDTIESPPQHIDADESKMQLASPDHEIAPTRTDPDVCNEALVQIDDHSSIRSVSSDRSEITTPDVAERSMEDALPRSPNIAKEAIDSGFMDGKHGTSGLQLAHDVRHTGDTISKTCQTFKVPYKARDRSKTYFNEIFESTTPPVRQISIYTSLNNPANPLPQFTSYRVELALSWGEAHIFQWLPGRKYIPTWDLKIAGGNVQDPVLLDVRAVMKTVVAKLPVLCRFAAWL